MSEKPKEKIQRLLQFIEKNITGEISLDILANSSGLSKYHLDRIFRAITRKSLIDYVRNRKLSCSLYDLLNTDLRIIDIASNYNFKYEQSYIRAFTRRFHISPDRYRKEKPLIEITDKINLASINSIGNDGMIVNPAITLKPRFAVIGIEQKSYFEDNEKNYTLNKLGNDFYYNHSDKILNPKSHDTYLGLIRYVPGESQYCYYTACLEVLALEEIPPGMTGEIIPTNKYAVFKYIGLHHPNQTNIAHLMDIKQFIYGNWLINSGYELSGLYHMESMNGVIARDDYCEVDIYLPVQEKTQSIKHEGTRFI